MHILDLIIYIIFCIILWACLSDDFKQELGTVIGIIIMLVFSIIYIVIFAVYPDFNWIDIFNVIKFNKLEFKL